MALAFISFVCVYRNAIQTQTLYAYLKPRSPYAFCFECHCITIWSLLYSQTTFIIHAWLWLCLHSKTTSPSIFQYTDLPFSKPIVNKVCFRHPVLKFVVDIVKTCHIIHIWPGCEVAFALSSISLSQHSAKVEIFYYSLVLCLPASPISQFAFIHLSQYLCRFWPVFVCLLISLCSFPTVKWI